jgi:hypothetical protein
MKKIVLAILFLGFSSICSFAQHIIWSTVQSDVGRTGMLINISEVKDNIMKLYNQYNYYYDDTGYDIDYFLQAFGQNFMLAHLPKSAVALEMTKDGFVQVQVLIFILYEDIRISGCLIFSDAKRGNAIETNSYNKDNFETLVDNIWVEINYPRNQ